MASDRVPPVLADLIASAIQSGRSIVDIPARVERYDAATQKIDAKPLVQRSYFDEAGDRQVESFPVVPSVPVLFPGGGGYRVVFPVAAGDFCLLIISSVPLDRWLSGRGGEVDPEVDDGGALHHAVALVGLHPFGAPLSYAPAAAASFGQDSASGGLVEISSSGSVTIKAKALGSERVDLDCGATGEVRVNGNGITDQQVALASVDTAGPYPIVVAAPRRFKAGVA
jgi:hypothetical protein